MAEWLEPGPRPRPLKLSAPLFGRVRLFEVSHVDGHEDCCGSGDDPLLGVDYLCLDMALASLRLQGPTGKLVLHTEQNRMRHSAQETLRIAARDRHPGIYAPLLFGAVYGAITAALEGALDVHVPDGASTAQPGSIDYEEFLELAFDYLRSGF